METKQGKTLFLGKKRGDADSDLVKPAAAALSEVKRIFPGTLKRLNAWDVTADPISGRKELLREEGPVTRKLLFEVKYDTEDEIHLDLRSYNRHAHSTETILDADREAVFIFKGQETCDDSYGIVKFLQARLSRGMLICEGWVIREMMGSV